MRRVEGVTRWVTVLEVEEAFNVIFFLFLFLVVMGPEIFFE